MGTRKASLEPILHMCQGGVECCSSITSKVKTDSCGLIYPQRCLTLDERSSGHDLDFGLFSFLSPVLGM